MDNPCNILRGLYFFARHQKKVFPHKSDYHFYVSVYIELVLFNNLAVDFMLICATQTTRGRRISKLRTLLATLLGAICATIYAIAPKWATILIKLLLAPLMALIFDKYGRQNKRAVFVDYIKSLACFICYTYLVGGVVYGISYAIGVDVNSYAIEGMIALAIAIAMICAKSIAAKRAKSACITKQVTLSVKGKTLNACALCDSGNSLVDDVSGLPVVILSSTLADKLGKMQIDGYVNVSTVGGESLLPIVDICDIQVDDIHKKAMGAVSEQNFANYDIILQNSMF